MSFIGTLCALQLLFHFTSLQVLESIHDRVIAVTVICLFYFICIDVHLFTLSEVRTVIFKVSNVIAFVTGDAHNGATIATCSDFACLGVLRYGSPPFITPIMYPTSQSPSSTSSVMSTS